MDEWNNVLFRAGHLSSYTRETNVMPKDRALERGPAQRQVCMVRELLYSRGVDADAEESEPRTYIILYDISRC